MDPAFWYIKCYAYKYCYLWKKSGKGYTGLPYNYDHLLFSSTDLQGCLIHTIEGLPDNLVFFHHEPLNKAGEPATILRTIPFLQTQRKKKTNVTSLGPRPYSHSFLISWGLTFSRTLFTPRVLPHSTCLTWNLISHLVILSRGYSTFIQ